MTPCNIDSICSSCEGGGWRNRPCKAVWTTETTCANNRALTRLDSCDLSKDLRLITCEVDSSLQLSSPCQGTQYFHPSTVQASGYTLGETPIRAGSLGFASLSALLCNYPRSLKTFSRLWERQIRLSTRRNRVRTPAKTCAHRLCPAATTRVLSKPHRVLYNSNKERDGDLTFSVNC